MKSQPGWVTWFSHHQKNLHHPIPAYWGLRGVPSRGTDLAFSRPLSPGALAAAPPAGQHRLPSAPLGFLPPEHQGFPTPADLPGLPPSPPGCKHLRPVWTSLSFPRCSVGSSPKLSDELRGAQQRLGGWPPLFTNHVLCTLCPLSQETPGQSSERPRGGNKPSRSLTSPGSGRARICGEGGPTLEPTPPLGGHSTSQRPGLARIYKLDGLGSNSRSTTHRMPATFLRLSSPICSRRRGQNTVDALRGG